MAKHLKAAKLFSKAPVWYCFFFKDCEMGEEGQREGRVNYNEKSHGQQALGPHLTLRLPPGMTKLKDSGAASTALWDLTASGTKSHVSRLVSEQRLPGVQGPGVLPQEHQGTTDTAHSK